MTKPIPSTGGSLPVVGIGTSQIFDFENDPAAFAERRQVLEILASGQSGRIIDTAPSYGRAEARDWGTFSKPPDFGRVFSSPARSPLAPAAKARPPNSSSRASA